MNSRWNRRRWHYALLLALGALLFLVNLGGATLWDMDEGKNITCTTEMLAARHYVIPSFNGELRSDKPALIYWLQAFATKLCGVNEFSARLPSALAALGAVLLIYELARTMFGKSTGLLGGVIVACTPMLCGAARFANPDALLHFFILLTLYLFWIGQRNPHRLWWLAMGAAAGLGMLAKGPVAVVLPGAIVLVFLLWDQRLGVLFDRRVLSGIAACALVGLPWFIWVSIETKANFLTGFFMVHNVGRFTSTMEGHSGSIFYYPLVLLVGTAPWSIFVVGGLWCATWSVRRSPITPDHSGDVVTTPTTQPSSWRERFVRWRSWAADRQQVGNPEVTPAPSSAYRFLLTWTLLYVAFFSIAATKLPNYVLPVVGPLAILAGRFLDRWRQGLLQLPSWSWATLHVAAVLAGIGLSAGLLVAGGVGNLELLQGRFVPGLATLAWIGIGPIVFACINGVLHRRDKRTGVMTCFTGGTLSVLVPLVIWGSAAFNDVKAPGPLVAAAGARQLDQDIRVASWELEHLPSLNYYAGRDVVYLQSNAELYDLLRYPLAVYVFLPAQRWEKCPPATRRLGRELARHADLYRAGDVIVVTNQ